MQKIGDHLRFSASDLVSRLDCRHLTALDAAVARGSMQKPKIWDHVLQALGDRGLAHERQFPPAELVSLEAMSQPRIPLRRSYGSVLTAFECNERAERDNL
jgi:hypothetical protein